MRQGAYPRLEHLKGALLGWPTALPANIRLGCKGLFGKLVNYGRKKFIVQAPGRMSILAKSNIFRVRLRAYECVAPQCVAFPFHM